MKRLLSFIAVAALILGLSVTSRAQVGATASFTWIGGGPNYVTQTVEFATIDDTVTNQQIGFAGAIEFNGYGSSISLVELPQPGTCSLPPNPDGSCSGEQFPAFPNNGFLAPCGNITFGAKQWGTRADGTVMDGTKAGDSYLLPVTATCTPPATVFGNNPSVALNFTEFREMIAHRSCVRFGCHTYLADTMESGYGTAEVTQ